MIISIDKMDNIYGLDDAEAKEQLKQLVTILNDKQAANAKKIEYYNGNISLHSVNLGVAMPENMRNLRIGCEWGAKCVDVLASRSMFDGFVAEDGGENQKLTAIMDANNFIAEYQKACRDELKLGAVFATLSGDEKAGCKIRFHSELTASAIWDGEKNRIACGMAIIDTVKDETDQRYKPSLVNLYTEDAIYTLHRIDGTQWTAEKHPHIMGRPLMVAMVWNPTSGKPFGRSRIKAPVRSLIDSYVRTVANATIGLEFATSPQKYILGVTDQQYDQLVNTKFKNYIGSILTSTANPETGQNPQFGQLAQGTIEPHVAMMRILATQFSAATGLSVTDTGVVNDANPTSSEAIQAQTQTLILMAEQLNSANGNALKTIAQMAQAIAAGVSLEALPDEQKNIIAHFKNPAMPSVSVTADAALKIASVRQAFADTDTFLEMIGFDQADIRRINGQEARTRGMKVLTEEFGADEDKQNQME